MMFEVTRTETVEYGGFAVLPLYNFLSGQLSHAYSSAANDSRLTTETLGFTSTETITAY